MKRTIIASAPLAPAALDELKAWLAITSNREDAALLGLLGAALEMCEAFTGERPLWARIEERVTADGDWQRLSATPASTILSVEELDTDGTRGALASDLYAIDIDGTGAARVRVTRRDGALATYEAGMTSEWGNLPAALRHGVIRLAAALHRSRDSEAMAAPPSAVAALWQPFRRMRLA